MEVTNFQISQETLRKLNAKSNLSAKDRSRIRYEGVKRLVQSKHSGYLFLPKDIMNAAGYRVDKSGTKEYQNGMFYLRNLIKRKLLIKGERVKGRVEYYLPDMKIPKKLNKPMLQAKVQVVDRNAPTEDTKETEDKPSPKKSEASAEKYTFELTMSKKNQTAEFGKTRMAQLEMTDVNIETARKMINDLLDRIS